MPVNMSGDGALYPFKIRKGCSLNHNGVIRKEGEIVQLSISQSTDKVIMGLVEAVEPEAVVKTAVEEPVAPTTPTTPKRILPPSIVSKEKK